MQYEKILFQETNYRFINEKGQENPRFDTLITKGLVIPLVILILFFFALNIYEFFQAHIYIPYIFQNLLLLVVLAFIFIVYPRQKIIITRDYILLRNNKKIVQKIMLPSLKKITLTPSQRYSSIFRYYRVDLETLQNKYTFYLHQKKHFEKVIKSQTPSLEIIS